MPRLLCGDGEAAAGNLLGVCLVEFRQNLLESGAVKAVGKNSGVADDVLTRNQFFHLSGLHFSLDGVADGISLGFEFFHHSVNNVFDNMRHAGVRFCGFEDVTIQGNTFIKKTEAESVNYRASGCFMINLYCYNNTTDALDPNKRVTIDNNTFHIADPLTRAIRVAKDNEAYLGEVTDIAITNNTIHNTSTGSKDIGIQALRISDGLTITGNTIQGGYRGIEVQYCAGNITISSNQISGLAYQHFRFLSCGTKQTICFYTHGNGTVDVSTSGGTYTMTAIPNAGSTFAGYYKQNTLTTLITTSRVQQVPVNQASNYFRHPSFEG